MTRWTLDSRIGQLNEQHGQRYQGTEKVQQETFVEVKTVPTRQLQTYQLLHNLRQFLILTVTECLHNTLLVRFYVTVAVLNKEHKAD